MALANLDKTIGIPVEEVGKKIRKLNKILKEHNMILKAENDVGICFWKGETQLSA